MKQKLLLLVFTLFSITVFAQDIPASRVPAVVKNSFSKAFPKATRVEWEMKGDLFNADFDLGRKDHEVWINSKGVIVKHKQELRSRELPEAVSKTLKQHFKAFWIDDVDRYDIGKEVFYKIELKTLTEEKNIVVDSKGAIVNRIL